MVFMDVIIIFIDRENTASFVEFEITIVKFKTKNVFYFWMKLLAELCL